jgi:nucleotide-binding universal stress UspA family protein
MKGCRKILIAVNGEVKVLDKGLELSDDEKCWITVLKVIPSYEGDLDLTGISNLRDVLTSNEEEKLDSINEALRENGAFAKVRVEEGDITETINRVAAEERCDLVVLGKKKRKGFLSRILGDGVVEKVSGSAPCPVLVVDT